MLIEFNKPDQIFFSNFFDVDADDYRNSCFSLCEKQKEKPGAYYFYAMKFFGQCNNTWLYIDGYTHEIINVSAAINATSSRYTLIYMYCYRNARTMWPFGLTLAYAPLQRKIRILGNAPITVAGICISLYGAAFLYYRAR